MSKGFVIVLMLFLSGLVHAKECVTQSEMQEIAKDFKQFQNLESQEFCYDGSESSNLISSIMFMRKTAFQPNMPKSEDELFSGRFASSWYGYFTERISVITIPDNCPKGVAAYVYGFGSTMYVCPMMLTSNFTSLDRASVFMHEARHMDGFRHITCRTGPRAGMSGACDNKISDEGSYAVTVETYAQIAKYAVDLHPALKAYSMSSAATYADETFENPARVSKNPILVMMNQAGQFFSLDLKDQSVKALGQSPSVGKIVMRAQHMILFPQDKTLPAKYVFTKNEGDIAQSAGDAILEYNEQTPAQKADLKDMFSGAQWSARVYTNRVKFACDPTSANTSEINLPAGQKASSILYLNGYSRASQVNTLATEDGSLLDFGCSNKRPFLRASKSASLDQKMSRVYKIADKVFAINLAGELLEIQNGRSVKLELPSTVGALYELAPQQTYDFIEKN